MTFKIGQRDIKFLISGGIFVTCYLLFLFVINPAYEKQASTNKKIKDKINFIEKYYAVLNQTSHYQAKKTANKKPIR